MYFCFIRPVRGALLPVHRFAQIQALHFAASMVRRAPRKLLRSDTVIHGIS